MTREEFRSFTAAGIVILDGATGTELAKRGMPAGVCPEAWIVEHPEAIIDVQQAYTASGSDIVYVPSFGANPVKLAEFGLDARMEKINAALVALSRRARPGKLIFGEERRIKKELTEVITFHGAHSFL